MGDLVIFFFVSNVFAFCLIFWLLTWLGEYFYFKKEEYSKKSSYECGFKNNTNVNIQINLNFAIVCVFLILYDIEFAFLIPFYFNVMQTCYWNFFCFNFFLICIFTSLIYDFQSSALNWTV